MSKMAEAPVVLFMILEMPDRKASSLTPGGLQGLGGSLVLAPQAHRAPHILPGGHAACQRSLLQDSSSIGLVEDGADALLSLCTKDGRRALCTVLAIRKSERDPGAALFDPHRVTQ